MTHYTSATEKIRLPGMRLRVPFGRGKVVGVLLELAAESDVAPNKLKAALEVLDDGYNPATGACEAVNDDLRQAMEGRGFQQYRIPGVRHGAEDLIRAGGLDRIPLN